MKKHILIFLIILSASSIFGQKYTTAAGIRIGTELGITVQQFLWDRYTLEGIAQQGLFSDYASVSLLFENHNKIFFKGLNFYFGAGPHASFYTGNDNSKSNGYGITLIGGIEARFNRLLASIDYKPAINFTGGNKGFDSQVAISLRYIMIKAKKKEQKWKFWEKSKKKKK